MKISVLNLKNKSVGDIDDPEEKKVVNYKK